ncbi:MAG: hypothetical protein RL501_247 [Bacteroidota bacterium]|jgi:hypothetical protein
MTRATKNILAIAAISCLGAIAYGITGDLPVVEAHRWTGAGTAALFLLVMPAFLTLASRGKSLKNYMLTPENIEKMQSKPMKSTDNQ